jgi:photosystem II stability/assembly factor-like uncharacterized protein
MRDVSLGIPNRPGKVWAGIAIVSIKILAAGAGPVSPGFDLHDIHFPTPSVGYAVGMHGVVLKTVDRGATWRQMAWPTPANSLHSVRFFGPDTGYVAGARGVFRTVDGGLSWLRLLEGGVEGFFAVDRLSLYAVLWNGASKSADGGETWSDFQASGRSVSLHFLDAPTGFMGGQSQPVRKTEDGGVTWTQVAAGPSHAIQFLDARTGFVAGGDAVSLTQDGGRTWLRRQLSGFWALDVHFPDPLHGFLVGDSHEFRATSDGGGTWTRGTIDASQFFFNTVYFLDSNAGFAAGANGYDTVNIWRTEDGGKAWNKSSTPAKFAPVALQGIPGILSSPFSPSGSWMHRGREYLLNGRRLGLRPFLKAGNDFARRDR